MPTTTTFEIVPQKLVFGGAALGYHEGRTVLVHNALPGERVEVEPLRESRGVVHGRLRRVLNSSPSRVEPPCPYFGGCGGCSYQHLTCDDQITWKVTIFREVLRRIGKLTLEPDLNVHSAFPWYYRNQARLRVGFALDGAVRIGFFALESHRLVNVEACRILSPSLNATLAELSQARWSEMFEGTSAIEMMTDDSDRRVMVKFCGSIWRAQGERLAQAMLAALPRLQTVAFDSGGKTCVLGEPRLKYRVGDFTYQISPGSFFQVSRFLLPELVRTVAQLAGQAHAGRDSGGTLEEAGNESNIHCCRDGPSLALDLYAGAGLFSLPLACRFGQVMAVESDSGSAADLALNVRDSGMKNVRLVKQSVFEFLRHFAVYAPEFTVLDPPRAGVGYPTLKLLARIKPKSICYVSCHPPTLARDLSFLTQHGYTITSMDLFDFFPQTRHLESVSCLEARG